MNIVNRHLNLFRFFNESEGIVFIENNLSRAFAICIMNSGLLMNEYIRKIVSTEDYQYLFNTVDSDSAILVNLQIETATIESTNYKKVYAVAMTSDKNLNMGDFFSQTQYPEGRNITDIVLSLKDIAIVIEVKRTGEDCKAQLFNQVRRIQAENNELTIIPKCFSWPDVIRLMENVKNVNQMLSTPSVFVSDFLDLSEMRYPEWFEPKPFHILPFSSQKGSTQFIQLERRMKEALAGVSALGGNDYELLSQRLGMSVPFRWAEEIHVDFESHNDAHGEYVVFYIYPGNTKQQGHFIYDKPMDWINKDVLKVESKEYELDVAYNIKLSHFSKFIGGMSFNTDAIYSPLHTREIFENYSGKWEVDDWNEFETLLDGHFRREFDWRALCGWNDNFVGSDRTYFTMSLGFEISLYIPYSHFKDIDRLQNDIAPVSQFIFEIAQGLRTVI